jgi:polyhydroxybutyrate depolymerase
MKTRMRQRWWRLAGPPALVLILSTVGAQLFAGQDAKGERQQSARKTVRTGATTSYSIKVGALKRSYALHVPPGLSADKRVPLVLMFHGGGGTPAYAERESKFSDLSDREGFLAAYPEGINKSWNDGRGADAIAALIDDVAARHKLDTQRVFATGISNGAIFSHYLAAKLSGRIAAIAPVAGGIPRTWSEKFNPDTPVSVLILQGVNDPLVPYDGGAITLPWKSERGKIISTADAVRKWVKHNGCKADAVEQDLPDTDARDGCRVRKFTYGGGRNGTEVVLCRIEGGGHTWPNGLQYLPAIIVGKVCRDIDGTRIIWDFFKTHPKPGP